MMMHGFPNLLMPAGPQSGSASTNYPRGIETGVNWCTDFLEHVWAKGYTRFEATEAVEKRWTDHVTGMYAMMLMRKAKSWFTGYNSNVAGPRAGHHPLPRLQRRLAQVRRHHQLGRGQGLRRRHAGECAANSPSDRELWLAQIKRSCAHDERSLTRPRKIMTNPARA